MSKRSEYPSVDVSDIKGMYKHLFEKIDYIQKLNKNIMKAKGYLRRESSWKMQLSSQFLKQEVKVIDHKKQRNLKPPMKWRFKPITLQLQKEVSKERLKNKRLSGRGESTLKMNETPLNAVSFDSKMASNTMMQPTYEAPTFSADVSIEVNTPHLNTAIPY